MHIESHSAYTPPLYTRATGKAANEDTGQASTAAPSKSQETGAANTAKAAPVTGVTGSNLSKEMVDQLMKAAQEAGAVPFTETERTLLDMNKERLDEALSDPKKARKYADSFRYIILIPGNGLQFPSNGSSDEVWERFRLKSNLQMSRMNHLAQERSTSIDKLRSEGRTDIEIIVSMLDFEANAPSRYGSDAIAYDQPNSVFNNQSYAQFSGEMRDYLTQQIKESSTQSVSPAQETGAPNTDTENYKGILSDIDRRHLDNIASDQKYAAEYAELLGNHQTLIPFRLEDYGVHSIDGWDKLNYAPESVKRKFEADHVTIDNAREGSFLQRQALYERKQSEGVSPAKAYAALLELTAGQAEFTSLVDKGLNRPEGQTAQWYQAQHDYLQNLIDQGKSATALTKSTDSTKVEG